MGIAKEISAPESLVGILRGQFNPLPEGKSVEQADWEEEGYALLLKATEILKRKGSQVGTVVSTEAVRSKIGKRVIHTRIVRNLRGLQDRYYGDPDAVSVTARFRTGRKTWKERELFMILGNGRVLNQQGEASSIEQIEKFSEILSFIDQELPERETLSLKLIGEEKDEGSRNNPSLEALRAITGNSQASKDELPWNRPVKVRNKDELGGVGIQARRIHEMISFYGGEKPREDS